MVGPLSALSFSVSHVSLILTLNPTDMFLPLSAAYEGIYIFLFISIPTRTGQFYWTWQFPSFNLSCKLYLKYCKIDKHGT